MANRKMATHDQVGCGCLTMLYSVPCMFIGLGLWYGLFSPALPTSPDGQILSDAARHKIKGEDTAKDIDYFYDERTKLCFARFYGPGGGITLVPYENVKHVLLNPPSESPE